MTVAQIVDNLFRDKNGKLAVVQLPNLSLSVWIVATIATNLLKGQAQILSSYVALGAIIAWASLEIVSGSSWFRRLLGAVILAMVLVNRL